MAHVYPLLLPLLSSSPFPFVLFFDEVYIYISERVCSTPLEMWSFGSYQMYNSWTSTSLPYIGILYLNRLCLSVRGVSGERERGEGRGERGEGRGERGEMWCDQFAIVLTLVAHSPPWSSFLELSNEDHHHYHWEKVCILLSPSVLSNHF